MIAGDLEVIVAPATFQEQFARTVDVDWQGHEKARVPSLQLHAAVCVDIETLATVGPVNSEVETAITALAIDRDLTTRPEVAEAQRDQTLGRSKRFTGDRKGTSVFISIWRELHLVGIVCRDDELVIASLPVDDQTLSHRDVDFDRLRSRHRRTVDHQLIDGDCVPRGRAVDDHGVTLRGRITPVDIDRGEVGWRDRIVQVDHVASGARVNVQRSEARELQGLKPVDGNQAGEVAGKDGIKRIVAVGAFAVVD